MSGDVGAGFFMGMVGGALLGVVLTLYGASGDRVTRALETAGAVQKCVEIGERKVCENVCPGVEWKVKP